MMACKNHPERQAESKGLCHSCYERGRVTKLKAEGCFDRQKARDNNNRCYAKQKKRYAIEDRERNLRYKKAAYALLGNKCAVCGFEDFRALQIDHVDGGGVKEIRGGSHATHLRYKRVLENPEKYQLLCANHNMIKRFERKEGAQQLDPGEADGLVPKEIEAAILNIGSRQDSAKIN